MKLIPNTTTSTQCSEPRCTNKRYKHAKRGECRKHHQHNRAERNWSISQWFKWQEEEHPTRQRMPNAEELVETFPAWHYDLCVRGRQYMIEMGWVNDKAPVPTPKQSFDWMMEVLA